MKAQLGRLDREQRLLHTRLNFRSVDVVNPETEKVVNGQLQAGGKLFLVHFWSVNCPPCRVEMPALAQLLSRLNTTIPRLKDQLRVVFVAEDNLLDYREGLKKLGLRVPADAEQFLINPQSAVRVALREGAQPLTLLVDRSMVVRQAFIGPLTERGIDVLTAVDRFVGSQSGGR